MAEYKYCKKDILKSKKFHKMHDALCVILEDNKEYTVEEVNKLYKEFMEREVK